MGSINYQTATGTVLIYNDEGQPICYVSKAFAQKHGLLAEMPQQKSIEDTSNAPEGDGLYLERARRSATGKTIND